jgi:hypothetical protein
LYVTSTPEIYKKIIEILLVNSFRDLKNQSSAGIICHANFVSIFLDTTAFGTAEEPEPYVLPVGFDGELGEIKFNDNWSKGIEHSLGDILPLIITYQP